MAQPAFYGTLNKDGVDMTVVYTVTASTTPETPAPPFLVGEQVFANNGSIFIFCQASTSISPNDFLAIKSSGQANSLTTTNIAASGGVQIGVAPGATAGNGGTNPAMLAGTYFWAALTGHQIPANAVAATTTSNVQLYTSATAGIVTSLTTSGVALGGIVVVASATANPQTFMLTWPRAVVLFSSAAGTIGGTNNP